MKFLATLVILIIGFYFGTDYLLSTHFKNAAANQPIEEKALVQGMAKFLEQSPDLQQKITDSGQKVAMPAPAAPASPQEEADLEKLSRYFGSSPADQYFKGYLVQKKKVHPENPDEQTKLLVEVSGYIREHPKDAVESLENALQSVPTDLPTEREALSVVFIHSAINFLEDESIDESTKKAYYQRFINNSHDEQVKDALESHFPDFSDPAPAPSP